MKQPPDLPSVLLPQHQAQLDASGISAEVARGRGYRSITRPEELEVLGFSKPQRKRVPGLLIPIHNVDGKLVQHQYRPDNPRQDRNGKVIKYETVKGKPLCLDVPISVRPSLGDPKIELWIAEGSKKVDAALSAGLCCIGLMGVSGFRGSNCRSGRTILWDWGEIAFNGRTFIVCYDSDVMLKPEVHVALLALDAMLKGKGAARVLFAIPPAQGEGKVGLDDYLAAGGTVGQLKAMATEEPPSPPNVGSKSTLPRIIINGRQLREVSGDALSALLASNDPPVIFRHGTSLCRIVQGNSTVTIQHLTRSTLQAELARAADWYKGPEDKLVAAIPPDDIAEDILSMRSWPDVPRLSTVTRTPILTPTGRIFHGPGYCQECEALVLSDSHVVTWPGTAVEAAHWLVHDVYGEFPYASEADRTHLLGLVVQPFVRHLIDGPTPLHNVDAPERGTGKSILAAGAAFPFAGEDVSPTKASRREEDMEKKITSLLAEGATFVFFDNVSCKLDSDALSIALTATNWKDRILGVTGMVDIPVRCTWIATTNNGTFGTDIARRTVWIRLDAKMEQPWTRDGFKRPGLVPAIREERPKILGAILSILESWAVAGMPTFGGRPLGTFESWSRIVGGILEHVGMPGFLSTSGQFMKRADPSQAAFRRFVVRWHDTFGHTSVKVADLYPTCAEDDEMLELLGDKGEQSQKTKLGLILAAHDGRTVGDLTVTRVDEHQGARRFKLTTVGDRCDRCDRCDYPLRNVAEQQSIAIEQDPQDNHDVEASPNGHEGHGGHEVRI